MAQTLSATARRDKAARDKAFAMTPARKAKKAHAERMKRAHPEESIGQDYDHHDQAYKSVKDNRGNDGKGTKSESGNNYNTD